MKTVRYIYMLLLPLMMAGCGKDGFDAGVGTGQNGAIAFEIGFADRTRVSTGVDFASTWENNDAIGIFAVANGSTLEASGNYIHNAKLTYDKTENKWTSEVALYWPQSGKLDFYAYYPYDASATDPTAIAFSVSADQNLVANYNKSDLLTAASDNSGSGWGKGTTTVGLIFDHALSLVQVDITDRGVAVPEYYADHLKVTMHGVQTSATLDLSDGTVAADGNAGSVVMTRVDMSDNSKWIYRALVPSQTIVAGAVLFTFEQDMDGDEDYESDFTDFRFVYCPSQAQTLAAGKYTEFDIKTDWGDYGDYTPAAWAFIRWAQETDGWQTSDFTLAEDIDLTGYNWKPVGDYTTRFTQTFEGGGHTITGLSINRNADYVGLFGYVGSGGKVQNVTVTGTVTGTDSSVGGIAGYNYDGSITGCSFSGTVTGTGTGNSVGGIVGYTSGTITGCSVGANSTVTETGIFSCVGGIAGYNAGTITGCSVGANSTVKGTGSYVGGIVGYTSGTITSCSVGANSTVKGTGSYVGDIAGYNTGGIAGRNQGGTITGCSVGANSTIESTGPNSHVGGIVGGNYLGTITGSWSAAKSVTKGAGGYVGGIVGFNDPSGTIRYCHWLWDGTSEGFNGNAVGTGGGDTDCEKFATVLALNDKVSGMNSAILSSGWQWVVGTAPTSDWPKIVKQ